VGYAFLPFLLFRHREKGRNVVFWKRIQSKTLANYKNCVKNLSNSAVNNYYARENHEISRDLMHRFVAIELSIVFLIVGLVFVAVYFLFFAPHK